MFLLLARFHARPMSYKALILAFTTVDFLNEKGEIRIKEEKSRLPVDVRGSKTSGSLITLTSGRKINSVSTTAYNKLPRHSKICNIAQHSKESTWTNMGMTSFAPEEFFWGGGGRIGVQRKTPIQKLDYFPSTILELRSLEQKKA